MSVLATPRWLVLTVVVAALVPSAVRLGFWQLDRLEERRQENAVWDARLSAEGVPIEVILAAGESLPTEQRRNLRVTVEGQFLAEEQVLVRNRSLDGQPGSWVATPMRLPEGSVVVVVRGWVPFGVGDPGDVVIAPPGGTVVLEGVLIPGEHPDRLGPTDPVEGRLGRVALLDLERLGAQVGVSLGTEYVQQTSTEAGVALPPKPLALPDVTDEGPHLAYAIQWFSFAVIGAVGWAALVRREGVRRARSSRDSALEVVDGADPE